MTAKRTLITGGYGCIGAELAKWLLRSTDGHVVIGSRSTSEERSQRIFAGSDRSRMTFVSVDVQSGDSLLRLLDDHDISHVVHLAALQTPDCNTNRDLGLQINLAGTQNLIEAMKSCSRQVERFIFASSAAVYGPRSSYPAGAISTTAELRPVNAYGTWKLAGEHLSRLFSEEHGTPSVCIRPGVLFGPGRDAGLTSTPTTAMKQVARGLPYTIPFRSRQDYLYAPDVGASFGHALTDPLQGQIASAGYDVFNLPSHTVDTERFADEIRDAAKASGLGDQCNITVGDDEVPFICDLDGSKFRETFPMATHTDLSEAVRQSLRSFVHEARTLSD